MSFASSLYETFIFRREKGFLYNIDPRIKALSTFIIISLIPFVNSIIKISILLILVITLYVLGGTYRKLKYALSASKSFIIFLVIIVYFFEAGGLLYSPNAVIKSIIVALKLITLMIAFSLLFTTTHPDDMTQALVKIGVPYTLAYTIVLSLRFVPTIARDIAIIYDAQRSRGLELEKGGFINRLRKTIPILIPAFVITLIRVDKVAEALESRCFGYSKKRTFLHELRIGRKDLFFLVFVICFSIILYIIEV